MAASLGFGAIGSAGFGLAAAFVSTETVRAAIERRLETWLGREVSVGGDVSFSAFPTLAISAERLRVGSESSPLATAAKINGHLNVASLLMGRVELASLSVQQPKIEVSADDAAALGGLWRRVSDAGNLGAIHVESGQATVISAGIARRLENLTFSVKTSGVDEPIVARGAFRYAGQEVRAYASLDRPLALASGESSKVELSVSSQRLNLSLNGQGDLNPDFAFDGTVSASTASLREALDWLKLPVGEGRAFESFALSGALDISGGVASLSDAALDLGGNHFEGAVAFGFESERPVLQATLDARHLDLTPWLAYGAPTADFDTFKLLAVDGDIRVSAETLTLGGATLGSTAAAVVMRDRLIEVTLGEMNVFDGAVSGRVSLAAAPSGAQMSAAFRVDQIEAGQFLTRLTGHAPITGRVEAMASLTGHGASWRDVVRTLEGEARLRLTDGTLHALLPVGGRLANLIAAAGPSIEHASARFAIADGVAVTQDFAIDTFGLRASVNGSLSLIDGKLALRGVADAKSSETPDAPFLLSGVLNAPVLSDEPATPTAEGDADFAPSGGAANMVVDPNRPDNSGLLERIIGRF